MGIVSDHTNLFIFTGIIVCIIVGCILLLLDKKDLKDYKESMNPNKRVKKLKHTKRLFIELGFIFGIIMVAVIYIFTICLNQSSASYGEICGTAILMNSVSKFIKITIISIHLYIIAFHIVWMLFEKLYIKKKIMTSDEFSEEDKKILIDIYATSNIRIIGYAIICQAIPLAIRLLVG